MVRGEDPDETGINNDATSTAVGWEGLHPTAAPRSRERTLPPRRLRLRSAAPSGRERGTDGKQCQRTDDERSVTIARVAHVWRRARARQDALQRSKMHAMAKSEKPALGVDPKSVAKSGAPKAAAAAPPRAKTAWAHVVSRATPPKALQGAPAKMSQRPAAKPSQRPSNRLKPPPLPKIIDENGALSESVIEVSSDWLEEPAQGRRVSKRPSKPTQKIRFAEAVRVLVGPNGELEVLSDPTDIPRGYVEAFLVATSGGLAERLLKR
jgi:hypothetical protein